MKKGTVLEKFSSFVVKARYVFLVLFLAAVIVCCVMIPKIKVKYDLTSFMPDDSNTSQALQVLKEEFDDKGMAYVCVTGIDSDKAAVLSTEIASIEGVGMVTFIPESNYNEQTRSALFTVVLSDYDSTEGAFDAVENIISYLDEGNYESYLTGQSAYSYFTRLETEQSILKLGIVIVIAIIVILLFTSRTYFELVPMLVGFGAAVALNMGTNVLFTGGISYISNMITLVLQLALSLDYSIILLHRFIEERAKCEDVKEALTAALSKGIIEILSSSMTTVAGLISLTFMTLPIGVEIGLALAKGIVASLLTVIFLLPALLCFSDKLIRKTVHKPFVPKITKPSAAVLKGRKVIVPVFLIIVVLSGIGQFFNSFSFNYNGGSLIVEGQEAIKEAGFGTLNSLVVIVPRSGGTEKEKELIEYVSSFEIIDETVNSVATTEFYGIKFSDEKTSAELKTLLSGLTGALGGFGGAEITDDKLTKLVDILFEGCYREKNNLPEGALPEGATIMIADLLDYMTEGIGDDYLTIMNTKLFSAVTSAGIKFDLSSGGLIETAQTAYSMLSQIRFGIDSLRSEDYSRITFTINAGVEDEETFALLDELYSENGVKAFYDEFYIAGESVACYDMADYFVFDNMIVSVCSLVFVLVILLFTFRNFSLPIILALAIQGGIWINFVIPFLAGNMVSFIGYLIITAIQMGATIDYAIVLTNRYRTTKHFYPDRYVAMAESVNAVFPTILTSGSILTITGFALSIAASGVVSQMGLLLGIGTLASMIIVLLVLPSMLLLFEKIVDKTNFPKIKKKKKIDANTCEESA